MSWSVIIADENPRTMTWMDACVSLTTFPSERHLGGKKIEINTILILFKFNPKSNLPKRAL